MLTIVVGAVAVRLLVTFAGEWVSGWRIAGGAGRLPRHGMDPNGASGVSNCER